MKKVFLTLTVLMALSAMLFAGGGGQQASGQQAAGSGKTQIRASYWGDTKRFELYDSIIKQFESAYPNVTVIREPVSWDDYWDKLSIQAAGGNAPDFLCMHSAYAADYLPRGVLEPLDPYVQNGTINLSGWSQNIIDTGKYNGKLYMLAMGVTYNSVFINTGVFKQLGITAPGFEYSWDDVKTIGLQVRQAYDAQGKKNWMLNSMMNDINSFRYFLRQRNKEAYDANGNLGFTAKDVEDWYAMWKGFQDMGITPDPETGVEFADTTLENSLFGLDRVLMTYVPVNQIWLYRSTFPNKEINVIRLPGAKGSQYVGEFPEGAHFGVSAKTSADKKTAAAQLLNFWLNDARSLKLFQLDQGVPANEPILRNDVLPILNADQKVAVDYVNTLDKIATPSIYPPTGASEIDDLFDTKAQTVQFGQETAAAAAQEFYDGAAAIRAKAGN